jgi:hypothetical protein
MHFFARHCGFDEASMFTGTLSSISHCFSADVVVNLVESRDWRTRGAPFGVLSLGPSAWGAFVMEAVNE